MLGFAPREGYPGGRAVQEGERGRSDRPARPDARSQLRQRIPPRPRSLVSGRDHDPGMGKRGLSCGFHRTGKMKGLIGIERRNAQRESRGNQPGRAGETGAPARSGLLKAGLRGLIGIEGREAQPERRGNQPGRAGRPGALARISMRLDDQGRGGDDDLAGGQSSSLVGWAPPTSSTHDTVTGSDGGRCPPYKESMTLSPNSPHEPP